MIYACDSCLLAPDPLITVFSSFEGISFYDEVGFLIIGKKEGPYVTSVKDVIEKNDINCQLTEGGVLKAAYPYLKVSPDTEGIYTSKKSGHISPRLMVIAQRQIAMMLGCDIINDVAQKIEEKEENQKKYLEVTTEKGRKFVTRKVLLATGAFTECKDLLPRNKQLAIENYCTTTLLVSSKFFSVLTMVLSLFKQPV